VQLIHVALVGAGAGGGALGVGGVIGQTLLNYGMLYSGGGGAYLELDYPILDRSSISYSIGKGGAGAASTVVTGTTNGQGGSVANAINSGSYDATWPVPSSVVAALQAARAPVSLLATSASATGANTITFNAAPADFGVVAGWAVGTLYENATPLGTIQSISGNTITLTGTLSTAVAVNNRLCMYAPTPYMPLQLYVPSTNYVIGRIAIGSATSLIANSIAAAPGAGNLVTGLGIVVSTALFAGANGGATTFGEYSAGGGYGSGAAGGAFVVPGLPAISLQSAGYFPYQTSGTAVTGGAGTNTSSYQATSSGGRAGGGFMSAAFGVGAAGVNGGDGGPGCGGAASLPTNSATPVPAGGKGGDGLLVILY
jgi:hypothetical protein